MLLNSEEKEEYAIKNQRLVYHTCQKFSHSTLNLEELLGFGQIGFVKALNNFDKDKNFEFSTFAVHCIKNEILLALRKENKHATNTISMQKPLHEDSSGNELLVEDTIVENMGQSLDMESEYIKATDNEFIIKSLNILTPLEKEIIMVRYGLCGRNPKTQKEIAELINMSQANISKIEKKALSKLKEITVLRSMY